MVHEVHGNYVEGLEKDVGNILGYFGKGITVKILPLRKLEPGVIKLPHAVRIKSESRNW